MKKVTLANGEVIGVRDPEDDDYRFIMSSWLQSFKPSRYAGPIPNNMYWDVYAGAIEQLLEREGVKVLICCNPTKESQIFGYLVVEENRDVPVVHWLYVKQPFRGMGIARGLMGYCNIHKDTLFYYTYKSVSAGQLACSTGPWPTAKHKDSIARKKRRHLDETTGYLVPHTKETEGGHLDETAGNLVPHTGEVHKGEAAE